MTRPHVIPPDMEGLATPLGEVTRVGAAPKGRNVQVSMRPGHLLLKAGEDSESLGHVALTDRVFQGAYHRCRARITGRENVELLIHIPADQAIAVGDEVHVHDRRRRIVLPTD